VQCMGRDTALSVVANIVCIYTRCVYDMIRQMDNQVIVSDYSQMDRVLRDERQYILNIVKQVKKAGCNVLLIQKSILRYLLVHACQCCGGLV